MHKQGVQLLVLLVAVLGFSSCVSKKKFDELTGVKNDLSSQLDKTKGELADMTKAKEEVETELTNETARLNGSIEKLKSDLRGTENSLGEVKAELKTTTAEFTTVKTAVNGMFTSYETKGLQLTNRNGEVVLSNVGPVYFRSGSAYLNKESRESLNSLATTLQENPGLSLNVVGHADNQGVVNGASIGNNQRLSYLRAENVIRYLVRKGAAAAQLSATGKGDAQPAMGYDGNDIKEARKMNRRVEFLVAPSLTNVYGLGK